MKEINERFKKWNTALINTKLKAESTIADIRKAKAELMQLKTDLDAYAQNVHYLRDNRRLVLSAPEIIIGNVDPDGVLLDTAESNIIIRGNNIGLEATGGTMSTGTIMSRASRIRQIAEDPGVDGTEHVVTNMAEVTTLAKSIALRTEDAEDVYSIKAVAPINGISILSENNLVMEAVKPCESKQERLEQLKNEQESISSNCTEQMASYKSEISTLSKEINSLVSLENLTEDEATIRTRYSDLEERYEAFQMCSEQLGVAMKSYQAVLFLKAESDRQIASLEKQIENIKNEASKFDEQSTGAYLNISSEHISIESRDGDGNLRTNKEAAIQLTAPHLTMTSESADGSLMKDSDINLSAMGINLSTANPKPSGDKVELPAEGDVHIVSKNITMEAVNYSKENDETKEDALTAEGTINMRAETMILAATDTEGKAAGSITANAKETLIKAMDVDTEKGADKSLAADGTIMFAAEDIALGAKGDKGKGKKLQIYADEVGLFAEQTLEAQQDSGKAIVQLTGGNTSVGGSKVETYGDTTIEGAATFKSPVKGAYIEMDSMKVKSAFQSPYTTEGTAVSGASSSAKLSAKLEPKESK